MSSTQNYSTLKWIRGELDASLTATRRSLEDYVESGDSALIDDCSDRLHQVHGSLQMMQIYGAAMLAEEMELVTNALKEEKTKHREEASEALMLGIIQLSEYLEKLEGGARDLPILLLPLLNELRATREAALLSEVAFISPELDRRLQSFANTGVANPQLSGIIKSNRHKYHMALLNWFRGTDISGGLQAIADIFQQVQHQAGTESIKRLFQVGHALLVALKEGSVDSGLATKQLVGRVDRHIKSIISGDESSVDPVAARDLLKNLLYYLACAKSANPAIVEIQQEFELENVIPDQTTISQERDALHAPGRALFDSLRTAIDDDLTVIKDSLDLYIRTQSDDQDRLTALEQPMRKLADTLGMIGQGGLRNRLKRQAERVAAIGTDSEPLREPDLMSMASDILFIETSLNNLSEPRQHYAIEHAAADEESALPQGEFERLVDSVMHEATVDMAKCKEAVITYIDAPDVAHNLSDVPAKFKTIAGAFRILKLAEPAGLMEQLANYVNTRLLVAEAVPETEELNAFADAITAIEYFMEAIVEGRGVQRDILSVAEKAVERLGLQSLPETEIQEEVPETVADQPEELPVEEEEPAVAASEESLDEQPSEPPGESASKPEAQPHKFVAEDIDPEILDIFIEEAREELDVIREYFPRWQKDREARDALITFRRSFHTLKGSGRLVGATTIGELAWSIEQLLNRIIDETVEVSPEAIAVISDCIGVLPDLIDCQECGEAAQVDVQPIMDRAFALADPNYVAPEVEAEEALPVSEPLSEETAQEAVTEEPDQSEETAVEADEELAGQEPEEPVAEPALVMDPILLEIFESESRGHIETLRAFIDACRENEYYCGIDDQLSRAWHTLHGSAKMAEVASIAAISSANEKYINTLISNGMRADSEVLNLLEDSVDTIDAVLAAINQPGSELPYWDTTVDEVIQACDALVSQQVPEHLVDEAVEVSEEITESPTVEDQVPEEIQQESEPESYPDESDLLEPTEAEFQGEDLEEIEFPDSTLIGVEELEPEDLQPGELDELVEPEPAFAEPETETPEPVTAVTADMVEVDGDPELIEIFLEEARELLESIETSYTQWREDISAAEPVAELERTLHTLKGGARLSGAMPIGDLSHAFESFLTGIDYARIEASPQVIELAQSVIDRLAEQIEDLSSGPKVRPADDLVQRLEDVFNIDQAVVPDLAAESEREPEQPEVLQPEPEEIEAQADSDEATAEEVDLEETESTETTPTGPETISSDRIKTRAPAPVRAHREQVRVRSDMLDRLVNHAGEVSIYRARIEQQNSALGFNLTELDQTVDRLRNQLRQLEIETEAQILFRYDQDKDDESSVDETFDPLELDRFSTIQQVSRSLLETVNDLNNIYRFLDELQKETDTLLLQQSRIMTDLQDGLMRTRMVPFSNLVPRLHRVVRQTCNPLGKQAELEVHGAEIELDRGILERMIGPFEHLLRNAVSHGIERPDVRRQSGKDAQGRITLDVRREGSDVLLTIADDGAGIDVDAIRQRAIKKGLLDPHAVVTNNDILQFVFEHGFSTADEVTQIAGRGVGLDVVVSEVKQLGGSLDISSEPSKGTHFIIRLPLTLAISDALLVELGEEIYAIPHTSIEGVVRVSYSELKACYEGQQTAYNYAGQDYQVRYLGNLLNVSQLDLSEHRKWYPLLLVRAGDHHVAMQVDSLIGNRQIVVKSVGLQVGSVRYISGGTILGDGRVALILDVTALVRLDIAHTAAPSAVSTRDSSLEPGVGRTVMVVDDSITVRKVTGRLLERHGMNVITAKDGVDAVAMLQEYRPDVMLLDIEMPRMDGYELARHMQNSEELQGIPIIMITSRSGDKHRKLAMELGVKRYLGKPYQEADLLDNIYAVLREATA